VSFPFIARNSWEDYSSSSVIFDTREEIIEYARDQLASAILEHRQQFAKNLAVRVAKGAAIVAFLMATDALAQDTGPAKDFSPHQPEEPAIGMSFDKR
jgi:hypothetical protein